MDNFLKTNEGFESTLKLIETINRSTDDYLFVWDVQADTRWFFGDIDKYYDIRKDGSRTNNTADMLKIIHQADRAAVFHSLEQIRNGEKDTHNMDYRWINRDGQKVWINCHGTVVRDGNGNPHMMIGRVSEENLRHLYNPLTGLWNKNKLRLDLKADVAKGGGYLVLLDVDGLAAINLTHGRGYGDLLLKEIADILENLDVVRTAYHADHDYFALVLNVESQESVTEIYKDIQAKLQGKCTFTAAAVPIDKASFYDETQLLDSANMTMKRAKETSRNRLEFFSAEELSRKIASLELLEELKRSIENDYEGYEVYYQPQVHVGTYELYGVEALLRYHSPTRGLVFPDEFIPVLEQSRLIKDVGLWVLEKALVQCKMWRKVLPNLHVSVNFSALQFEDANLAEKVVDRMKAVGLPGEALTAEITETVELHNSPQLIHTVKALKQYDINFAIDDFGTGYSNLGYLKQMNVDEIKIDRVFVSGLEKETYNHKLINNVIEFAKGNGIRTCCEGVENPQELAVLESLLPDVIQGFLFDRPNTAAAIEKRYIDIESSEYGDRVRFIEKMHELKAKLGIVYFDPKDILRENGVGLWMMRVNKSVEQYELHADNTLISVFAADRTLSPKESFAFWYQNLHPDSVEIFQDALSKMVETRTSLPMEVMWRHPEQGYVRLRIVGKRADETDGTILLEGYCRILAKGE